MQSWWERLLIDIGSASVPFRFDEKDHWLDGDSHMKLLLKVLHWSCEKWRTAAQCNAKRETTYSRDLLRKKRFDPFYWADVVITCSHIAHAERWAIDLEKWINKSIRSPRNVPLRFVLLFNMLNEEKTKQCNSSTPTDCDLCWTWKKALIEFVNWTGECDSSRVDLFVVLKGIVGHGRGQTEEDVHLFQRQTHRFAVQMWTRYFND